MDLKDLQRSAHPIQPTLTPKEPWEYESREMWTFRILFIFPFALQQANTNTAGHTKKTFQFVVYSAHKIIIVSHMVTS